MLIVVLISVIHIWIGSSRNAPFSPVYIQQPVPGAQRGMAFDGWKAGKLCDITKPPYSAKGDGKTNSTAALQAAIDDCGDLREGGTVLVPAGSGTFLTASLWLRSNLTLRVEKNATLLGTTLDSDAPLVYTRRECVMMTAHAGFLNAGRCIKMKNPLVGWDDCAEWTKLSNIVLEGGGTLDANGDRWWQKKVGRTRPMMLDLLWVDGLTMRDLIIRRPGFWTLHPTFSNNVRVTGMDVYTRGGNTDGIDPDSSWNVYIGRNTFDTGDDCIAIKSGRDWSGLMVNISTENVVAESNYFKAGHGVSIGSETSGWIRNVVIRNSSLDGTNTGVRIKSCRGRGGGVENVLYEGLTGKVKEAIQLTLNYKKIPPTNKSATPQFRNITIRNVTLKASTFLTCEGLSDSVISEIYMEHVSVTGDKEDCGYCQGTAIDVSPKPCFKDPPPTNCLLTEQHSSAECIYGSSYGCYPSNNSMWTTNGCRGVFTCDGIDDVVCDIHGSSKEFHVCNC